MAPPKIGATSEGTVPERPLAGCPPPAPDGPKLGGMISKLGTSIRRSDVLIIGSVIKSEPATGMTTIGFPSAPTAPPDRAAVPLFSWFARAEIPPAMAFPIVVPMTIGAKAVGQFFAGDGVTAANEEPAYPGPKGVALGQVSRGGPPMVEGFRGAKAPDAGSTGGIRLGALHPHRVAMVGRGRSTEAPSPRVDQTDMTFVGA